MVLRAAVIVASFFAFVLGSVVTTTAQGIIVPIVCDVRPCLPRPRPLPVPQTLSVKSIKLDVKITGQVATTHVEQIFRNDTPYTLEGTYFFPLPDGATVSEFAIWENGRKLVGEVRSREEARRIYDEIVRRQRDPGLLEYAGKNLFQASIFPIPGNSDKKLEITYSEVLKAESNTVSYRYPLGMGRLPTSGGDIPWREGMRRQEDSRNGDAGSVSGRIEIAQPQAIRNIYSPSHNFDLKRPADNKAVLTFESSSSQRQDFQLFYGLSESDFGMSLLTYREPGKEGYFLLVLSPKDNTSDRQMIKKDIVFVIDTSGSMADEGKMEKARAALLFGIRNLHEGDKYNVVSFAGEEHLMEASLISADGAGKRRGEEFVKNLQPSGGTNINDALHASTRQFSSSNRPKMLVFITDGLPTVGEVNAEKILRNTKDAGIEGLRIFTFGLGYDVNTKLLDQIAEETGGVSDYVEPREDMEVKVSAFFTKVNSPVLVDTSLDFGQVETDLLYPRKTPDIFRGTQLTILGRYRNAADLRNTVITLRGKTASETRNFTYSNLSFPIRSESNSFLPRLWAIRRVGWLVEQIRANGENKELRDEVIDLGTRYGLITPYTSYLATEGQNSSRPNMTLGSVLRSAPSTKDKAGAGFSIDGGSIADKKADAVRLSKEQRSRQETTTIRAEDDEAGASGSVSRIGAKTFYLDRGVWFDSEFVETAGLPEQTVKFGSEEYFTLAEGEKEIGQYLAAGKQIVLVWQGRVYRVVE
jgi:Ca-activated chloride channel homolog